MIRSSSERFGPACGTTRPQRILVARGAAGDDEFGEARLEALDAYCLFALQVASPISPNEAVPFID